MKQVLFSLILFTLVSCNTRIDFPKLICEKLHKDRKLVVVVFDISESTQRRRNDYLDSFTNQILNHLDSCDRIIVSVIGDNEIQMANVLVNYEILPYNLFGNEIERKNIIKNKLSEIINVINQTLKENTRYTKVLLSLKNAEQIFNTYREFKNKYLIIFSDMIEESEKINFLNDININFNNISEDLRTDLSGINVYVSGFLAVENERRLTENKRKEITNFWIRYFDNSKATFKDQAQLRFNRGKFIRSPIE